MRNRKPIRLAQPNTGKDDWKSLREPLESGRLTQGPFVRQFEAEFARLCNVDHAAATSSGTTALHLALLALGVSAGDEVVVPAFTWVATANAVVHCGARPVFVDISADTYNLDPTGLEQVISDKTKAVIAVHQFGLCADTDSIAAVIPSSVILIEDAACAVGALWKGRPAGSLGYVGCFSFHPRKVVVTGEGGMVVSKDFALVERIRILRNHGVEQGARKGLNDETDSIAVLGYNARLSEIHAALGLVQVKKLNAMITKRRRLAACYVEGLHGIDGLSLPYVPDEAEPVWQSFVITLEKGRDRIMNQLNDEEIETRPGTHSVPGLAYYRETWKTRPEGFPVSQKLEQTSLALPMHTRLTEEDVERVVHALRKALG